MVNFGCIPCTPEEAAHDDHHRPLRAMLVGAFGLSRAKVDLRSHLSSVLNQWRTSSCVSNAVARAMSIACAAKGQPIPDPSREWLYKGARYMRTPGVLVDAGSSVKAMCEFGERHGIVAESRLPFLAEQWGQALERGEISVEECDRRTQEWINSPPPFDADIAGQDALFRDYWRAGRDPEELRLALGRYEVPTFAIPVHSNFVDWSSDEPYTELAGDFLGYHMLALVGFDGDTFDVLNSWGTGWGRGGFCRMSASFIERHAFDRYVIRSAPASR